MSAYEGLKEGRAEGLKEANLENARRMKAKGYSIKDIMEITGLTMEDVSALTDN